MDPLPWTCPFCGRDTTLTDETMSVDTHYFHHTNKDGWRGLRSVVRVCPNQDCREFAIDATLYASEYRPDVGYQGVYGDPLGHWMLKPASTAKVFPSYIPEPIRQDYEEACAILDLSPKASATLSRRCLQGIIRDFWGISRRRLVDEINELQEKVDPLTWKAIDAVRNIGNIGAHMERDINLIVDVDPSEAELLISLLETLFKDCYVARHERQEQLEAIAEVAESKKQPQVESPS